MEQRKRPLCNSSDQVCDGVRVSLIAGLSLSEYVEARSAYCSSVHTSPCCKCERLLQVAKIILEQTYCSLPQAFRVASPGKTYTTQKCLPFASPDATGLHYRVGSAQQGTSFSILMEKFTGTDYKKFGAIINNLAVNTCAKGRLT